MIEYNPENKYKPYKIPGRQHLPASGPVQAPPGQIALSEINPVLTLVHDLYCEIEYEPFPITDAGHSIAKPHKIEPPAKDEIRDLFGRMRDIARQSRSIYIDFSKFYDRRVQQDSAFIFYQQAVFMQDFADDYPEQVPFSSYFPYYQMMGHEQLRTYFTWRTQVRKGIVQPTSLSYVFLYIYELLNNIGVASPEAGLAQLVALWTALRDHDRALDKYVPRWLKDYHIYYNLPQTFPVFIAEHHLSAYYPQQADPEDQFSLFCALAKYDIRKSAFFTEQTSPMITGCFAFVLERIRQDFTGAGIPFDDALFRPIKKLKPWQPFEGALFHPRFQQPDRRVIFSENELYLCRKNEWTFSTVLTTEKGRQFIGYLLKQMESVLRKVMKYKYPITANLNMVNPETLHQLTKSGLLIDQIIQSAVIDYYRESTKTVVTVDHRSLDRIRQEALATQEALIVEEPAEQSDFVPLASRVPLPEQPAFADQGIFADPTEPEPADPVDRPDPDPAPVAGIWQRLKDILDERERQALAVILQGADIRQFADANQVMLEVLADGINEKALDFIGDNLLDADLTIYEDYQNQVRGIVE